MMLFVLGWLILAGVGCGPPAAYEARAANAQLFRASILLRSRPPSPAEVHEVDADPGALPDLVRGWELDTPAVGALVRDLHARDLFVRADTRASLLPARGPLVRTPLASIAQSLDEAPLALVEHIVREGRPYTDIVVADYLLADPVVSAAYGPRVDRSDPSWQVTEWHDDRPRAGILSSTTLWMRHPSGNLNHHRSRATIVADALLCDDVTTRAAAGALNPLFQEDAVRTDPGCVSCHAVLDPLASTFWGFRPYIIPQQITDSYDAGCYAGDPEVACYPLPLWDGAAQGDGVHHGLPAPALYGQPVGDLRSLGHAIADDPRFAPCTVRRFWSYLARVPRDEVPTPIVTELAARLLASDFDAGALLVDIVTHPGFASHSPAAPPASIRPQHLARTVEGLTGYQWRGLVSEPYGVADLATTDRYGMNLLMGGLDGWRITGDEPGALPARELALDWLAEEAAAHAIQEELASTHRDLFPEGVPTDPQAARAQLEWWHLRILGEVATEDQLRADLALLEALLREGAPERAWTVLLAAMLQHPRLVVL